MSLRRRDIGVECKRPRNVRPRRRGEAWKFLPRRSNPRGSANLFIKLKLQISTLMTDPCKTDSDMFKIGGRESETQDEQQREDRPPRSVFSAPSRLIYSGTDGMSPRRICPRLNGNDDNGGSPLLRVEGSSV
ncbi:unnamed protein product [Pleuronectes platessa]|uniref:Uncharacterized protein n=1 Tax=Pleuronectes platessa TaxID=8262 RepID=A0A9N7V1M7_PLEPL|nr:unnamed protein product [Pleuronectes platessa]